MVRGGVDPEDTVSLDDVPEPEPGPDEARVRVLARPINPADLLLLEGRHVFTPTLPAPVGIEGAGIVEIGRTLAPGTRVAIPYGGTWTEKLAIRESELIPLPDATSLEDGAMLCVNPFTAAGLLEGLEAEQWISVNAATSAMGRLLLVLAAKRGIRSVAVARRADAEPTLRALGAEHVLVDSPQLAAEVRDRTGGGVHRALDAVAGEATGRAHGGVREGGAVWVYGLLASDRIEIPAAEVVFRDVELRGYSRLRCYRALTETRRREIGRELLELVASAEAFRTPIEARYPLAEVRQAVAHHRRARAGKILLVDEP